MKQINIGTCSWKYDSWRGLVYSDAKDINYLQEYSHHYNTVEVDQWFWSLFKENSVVLPKPEVVREYVNSVPQDFLFTIKVPNSITLTHHYQKNKKEPLQENPHFLSNELMHRFMDSIAPLHPQLGCLMFQFEYLNKQKMQSMDLFLDQFGEFCQNLPVGFNYGIEIRNPNYLKTEYFKFIEGLELSHVFLQGYYMPSVFKLYDEFKEYISGMTVIRLHGADRKGIEETTGKDWSQIVSPQNDDINRLKYVIADLHSRNVEIFIYVNNHFEGSAPRTIEKIING